MISNGAIEAPGTAAFETRMSQWAHVQRRLGVMVAAVCLPACATGEDLTAPPPIVITVESMPDASTTAEPAPMPSATVPVAPPPMPMPTPPDSGPPSDDCAPGRKRCGGICVVPTPMIGCSLDDCTPCPAPGPGRVSECDNGVCVDTCTDCSDAAAPPIEPPPSEPPPTEPPPTEPPDDPEFARCVALLEDDACTQCTCGACRQQSFTCLDSGDSARDESCRAIIECGLANHCTSTACYCGMADILACAGDPTGPCVTEINEAAETTDPGVVFGVLSDPEHAVTRARDLGDCAFLNCAAECGF